jgi:hypothetical protein
MVAQQMDGAGGAGKTAAQNDYVDHEAPCAGGLVTDKTHSPDATPTKRFDMQMPRKMPGTPKNRPHTHATGTLTSSVRATETTTA